MLGRFALASVLLAGCVGTLDDGASRPSGAPTTPGQTCESAPRAPGMTRLSRDQYDRTVRDLLGDATGPARAFTADDELDGVRVGGTVSPLAADELYVAAERLADAADLGSIVRCDPAADESACAREAIEAFAARAYRRPLIEGELDRLLDVYAQGRDGATFEEGIRWAISAALVSPSFLYLGAGPLGEELAPGDPMYGYAIASRLSYFLWGTMPDDALFAAAAARTLDTREGRAAEARRMLADPAARESVRTFFSDWLHVERIAAITKDATEYPEMSPELAGDLAASTMAYVEHATWEGGYRSLVTSPDVWMNERMASVYGIEDVTGDELRPVALDPGLRAGLTSQPGLLALLATADQTHPIRRGQFVRERVLCQDLPPPPTDVQVEIPPLDPTSSTRERFSMHATAECSGCHQLMDPIGFSLEGFDAIGRARADDHGHPIDDSGWVCDGPGCAERAEIQGAVELAQHLAEIDTTRDCVTREWVRYALRVPASEVDACEVQRLSSELAESDDLVELLVSIAISDSFARVGAPEGE